MLFLLFSNFLNLSSRWVWICWIFDRGFEFVFAFDFGIHFVSDFSFVFALDIAVDLGFALEVDFLFCF